MNNWQYHDNKMIELKKLYNRTSKQTQNRIQEIFESIDFTFDNFNNIADKEHKNRINIYIEEWKDKGLLTGYFGMLAKNIYNRTRVKNSEILELLIYGAYIEEQAKMKEQELNIMYEDANYYYQQGQQEVNNTLQKKERKPINILKWALFLALLDQPNSKGYIFEQYVEAIIKYNADQIYRQMAIDLQQQKQPNISNKIYQNIIKRQSNSKLNINGNTISGDIDTQLIGVNNLAKIEGIKELDNNAQVKFMAVIDGNETEMCHSLDNQIFYINKENVFDRYYGETQKDLKIERIKCFGLVTGLNLPPISHHFHWCRSYIMYLPNNTKIDLDKKYNIFDSKFERKIKSNYNINKAKLKGINEQVLINILDNMKQVYKDFPKIREKIKEIQSIEHPNGGLNIEPDLKDNKYIMQINRKFFSSEKIIQNQYEKDIKTRFHPEGTTYKDMGNHELGHVITAEIIKSKYKDDKAIAFDWNNDITAKQIVNQAFTNLEINDKLTKTMLRNNISVYARRKYSETIGEAFADYYANKENSNILSKEIINIMKGMV